MLDKRNRELNRDLSSNQMQMIALGGTIGVGLFMGSSATIKWTGVSVIFAYALAGFVLYLVMRALGEMLFVDPTVGSFANYATKYIHPLAGYLTVWANVFQWLTVGVSETIAVGVYLNYWFPGANLGHWGCRLGNVDLSKYGHSESLWEYGNLVFNDQSGHDYFNDHFRLYGNLAGLRE